MVEFNVILQMIHYMDLVTPQGVLLIASGVLGVIMDLALCPVEEVPNNPTDQSQPMLRTEELPVDPSALRTKLVTTKIVQLIVLDLGDLGQLALVCTKINQEHIQSQLLLNMEETLVLAQLEMSRLLIVQLQVVYQLIVLDHGDQTQHVLVQITQLSEFTQ